ncbi:MAG: hypothetical protein HKO12_07045 [Woeseiaceae bacterium]|nr:hypothetical protein [Woeseiaceae bacterium]
MEYQGPTPDDLANIKALNRLFLAAVSTSASQRFGPVAASQLTELQQARLADVPFLLFSFREYDTEFWQRILSDESQIDLIDSGDPPGQEIRQLQAAGLAFLWQLVQRNPYAARLVSAAPVSWCERLSDLTLVGLLRRAAMRGDLLQLRFRDEEAIWRRLLGNGISPTRQARLTSHHSALQAMLTSEPELAYNRVSAAACRIRETKV